MLASRMRRDAGNLSKTIQIISDKNDKLDVGLTLIRVWWAL